MSRTIRFTIFSLVLAAGALACGSDDPPPGEQVTAAVPAAQATPVPLTTDRAQRATRYDGPLPPIPSSPHAGGPPDVVSAVYEFAGRRPDVMRHVPCFCGCESNGHHDNEDCFVASRAADGRPQWDTHGLT